ncbi:MAG: substrate-binding domain-containing protein [Actinobacteria bacterium]|nr:substrate-binding domain-containing protein [Actinomycetota bacterium]
MHHTLRTRAFASVAIALAVFAGACAPDSVEDEPATAPVEGDAGDSSTENAGGDLSDRIDVSGSSTVEPISALVAQDFQTDNPGVAISVVGPGTGDGFALFCEGQTDISDASRPIKDEEAQTCADNGVEFTEIKVGIDGLTVMTNPANEAVQCVDFAALYALTGPESEGFANWSDAASLGEELGSSSPEEFPDAELTVVGPGEESGTYDSYVELVIEEFNEERGTEAVTRSDYEASPNDNVIIQGIQGSDTPLGWVGYAFFVENQDTVKALEVDGGDGCVAPTADAIASNEYPLARDLFIYVNNAKAEEKPALQAFVDYYLSDQGYAAVSEAGYVQLTEEDWQASQEAWTGR